MGKVQRWQKYNHSPYKSSWRWWYWLQRYLSNVPFLVSITNVGYVGFHANRQTYMKVAVGRSFSGGLYFPKKAIWNVRRVVSHFPLQHIHTPTIFTSSCTKKRTIQPSWILIVNIHNFFSANWNWEGAAI